LHISIPFHLSLHKTDMNLSIKQMHVLLNWFGNDPAKLLEMANNLQQCEVYLQTQENQMTNQFQKIVKANNVQITGLV